MKPIITNEERTEKYRHAISSWLRRREEFRAHGDPSRLDDIASAGDDYLLKRWLWTICLTLIPVAFVLVPFILSLLTHYVSVGASQILWTVAKVFMAFALLIFVGTIIFTSRNEQA